MPHSGRSTTQFSTENFYSDKRIGQQVQSEQYDIALGFFTKVMSTETLAKTFTLNLFRIANDTGVAVLTMLDSMKGKSSIGVSEAMAFYLNQVRPKSALIGVGNVLNPNIFVARNVLI
jgi:hypothetical protein